MSSKRELAPDGAVWVCAACGKYGKDAMSIGDESCYMWANLCDETTLVISNGTVRSAKTFKEQSSDT